MSALDDIRARARLAGFDEAICGGCCHFEDPDENDMGRCSRRQAPQFRFGVCLLWTDRPEANPAEGMKTLFAGAEQPLEPMLAGGGARDLACAEPGCDGLLMLRFSEKLNRRFYGCSRWPQCNGVLPANDDGTPRGEPRTRGLQAARNRAHEVFDRIWKEGHAKRRDAYAWLAEVMDMDRVDAHMFQMSEAQCEGVVDAVVQKGPGTPYWDPWVERRAEHKREKSRRRSRERRERKKRETSGSG